MYRPLPAENDVVTSLVSLLRYHHYSVRRFAGTPTWQVEKFCQGAADVQLDLPSPFLR
jgi:hypothetical protein